MVDKMKFLMLFISVCLMTYASTFSQTCTYFYNIQPNFDCEGVVDYKQTIDPIQDDCFHWPTLTGLHIGRLDNTIDDGPRFLNERYVINYNVTTASDAVDDAMDDWESSCDNRTVGFEWQDSRVLGKSKIVWSINSDIFARSEIAKIKFCSNNISVGSLYEGEDSWVACCFYDNFSNSTLILLNDSPQMYLYENPDLRWSTDEDGCDGTPFECYDVVQLMYHLIGRYSGIWPDYFDADNIMYSRFWESNLRDELSDCDRERFRLLYCRVGPSSVDFRNSDEIQLTVFPNPSSNDYQNVKFYSETPSDLRITLTDIKGQTVYFFTKTHCEIGDNRYKFPISNLSSGMYVLTLEMLNKQYSTKVIIQ